MVDRRMTLSQQVEVDVRQHFGDLVFGTTIPRNVRIAEAPSHGMPVLIYDNACAGSQAYILLASEFIRRRPPRRKRRGRPLPIGRRSPCRSASSRPAECSRAPPSRTWRRWSTR